MLLCMAFELCSAWIFLSHISEIARTPHNGIATSVLVRILKGNEIKATRDRCVISLNSANKLCLMTRNSKGMMGIQ